MVKSPTIKKLNNYLNRWLKRHGFECTVKFAADFSYDTLNEIISYSFIVPDKHDKLFLNFCKQLQPELIVCDTFLLSFFHELGHFITEDDFSEQELMQYLSEVNELDNYTEEDCIAYYNNPIEFAATKWACQYLIEHQKEVEKFFITVQNYEQAYIDEFNKEKV